MEKERAAPVRRSKKKNKKFNRKALIIILLVLAVACAAVAVGVHYATRLTNDSYKDCALGDINGDGKIDAMDALYVSKYTVGDYDMFDNQKLHADANADGEVNSSDALIILMYSIGMVDDLPYQGSTDISEDDGGKGGSRAFCSFEDGTAAVRVENEWSNPDGTMSYQLSVTVRNTGEDEMLNRRAKISVENAVSLTKSWDCDCKLEEGVLTVYIGEAEPDSAAVCGMIITAENEIKINNIEME